MQNTTKVLLTATVQSHICQFHKPLVEVLHKHGCQVHVAAKDNLAEKNGLTLDFADKVYNIPFSRSPKSPDNMTAYKQLKKIIDEGNYDIIHCNTPMGGIVTRLAARKARKNGTKVYYTAHGFHFYKGASKKNWLVFYPIEKHFAKYTDKLITINREDFKLAEEKFKTDVRYIHGVGVDEKRYYPVGEEEKQKIRSELGFTPTQKILLCVGELLPNKSQKTAVRVVKMLKKDYPDCVLLLAGNGPERENLKNEIKECGVEENVKMLGYCTCLEKYQRIADLSVSCSRREGLPLNIVEAMLTENPVVASFNRGHCELIEDGKSGYIVPFDDASAMYKSALDILSNADKSRNMGKYGREIALNYGFESVKDELESIYF